MIDKRDLIKRIREVAATSGTNALSYRVFSQASGISEYAILQQFDSWSEACAEAGILPRTRLTKDALAELARRRRISEGDCLKELHRIAKKLGKESVTVEDFKTHGRFSVAAIRRRFGTWIKGLEAAGLLPSTHYMEPLGFEALAAHFLKATTTLRRIPALHSVARRSGHARHVFSGKFGGYAEFKRQAIRSILASESELEDDTRLLLEDELVKLGESRSACTQTAPHEHGRILGFRQFAHVPTYEQEVVALFSEVAGELGFEILSIREAFPDCEAQRRSGVRGRYKKCRIEFEFRSQDYLTHKHPTNGCDLIVCWEHNWEGCPIEVLELRKRIRSLKGWR